MLSSIRPVGQSFKQHRALVHGFGILAVKPPMSSKSMVGSSFGIQ